MTNEERIGYGLMGVVFAVAIMLIIGLTIFAFGFSPPWIAFVLPPMGFYAGWRNAGKIHAWLKETP